MTLDAVAVTKATEYQKTFQTTLQAISEGTLNDFSPGSLFDFLSEMFGLGFGKLDENLNQEITDIVFGSIARLFGVENVAGVRAQIKLIFSPTNIDQVASFSVGSGFSVLVNGVVFRTDAVMTVQPGQLFGIVTATAVDPGLRSNISNSSAVAWEALPGLANIAIAQEGGLVVPGSDPLDYSTATNKLTGLLVNQALITVADYEALLSQQFASFTFSVIPNLDKDKVTKKGGIIHIFACNAAYDPLTNLEKLAISNSVKDGWALVYVSDFNILTLKISVIANLGSGSDPEQSAKIVSDTLKVWFSPKTQKGKTFISLNDAIAQVYRVPSITSVQYLSFDTGDGVYKSENIPVANMYTLAELVETKVQFAGLTGAYINV